MPYSNEVRVLFLSGEPLHDVSAKLWALWSEIDGQGRSRWRQSDWDSTDVGNSTRFTISFGRGPSFVDVYKSIGLSIHSKTPSNRTGPWFRSGPFDTLPPPFPQDPNGFIDVVLAPPQEMSIADLTAGLPQLPMQIPDRSETVTSLTLTPSGAGVDGRSLTVTASGPSGATTFTYTLEFRLVPQDDVRDIHEIIGVEVVADNLSFQASTGGGLQAAFKNAMSSFVVGQITAGVVDRIRRAVTIQAVRGVNAQLGDESASLPEGVVLSIRGIDHLPAGVRAWGALGAFGDVFARFPKSPGGTAGKCPLQVLALQGGPPLSLDLFRFLRDNRLPEIPDGPALRDAYYRHAPEAADLLRSDRALAVWARGVAVGFERGFRSGHLSDDLLAETNGLLLAIKRRASAELGADIEQVRHRLARLVDHYGSSLRTASGPG